MISKYQLGSFVALVTIILGSDFVVSYAENKSCTIRTSARTPIIFSGILINPAAGFIPMLGNTCRKECKEYEVEVKQRVNEPRTCSSGLICCDDPNYSLWSAFVEKIKPSAHDPLLDDMMFVNL